MFHVLWVASACYTLYVLLPKVTGKPCEEGKTKRAEPNQVAVIAKIPFWPVGEPKTDADLEQFLQRRATQTLHTVWVNRKIQPVLDPFVGN